MSQLSVKNGTEVVVHPLVLLSVADHYKRLKLTGTKKRVVGVLLGSKTGNRVDITNSFAVPFEESNNPKVWFLDHSYLESMFWMFKKVNSKFCRHCRLHSIHTNPFITIKINIAREEIVGFYSSGPKIKENDLKVIWLQFVFRISSNKTSSCFTDQCLV